MPSTLPLSVTGPRAARRPAQRSTPAAPLPLALACLASCLLPAGGALALSATRPPAAEANRIPAGSGSLPLLAFTGASVPNPTPAATGVSPVPVVPIARPRQPAAPAGSTAGTTAPPPVTGSPSADARPADTNPAAAPATLVISEAEFQQQLRSADLDRLDLLCRQLADSGDDARLRLLRERLLTIHPAPQPLAVVLANAEVMLSCRMPDGALTVLDRIGPARGAEQLQWLTLQWRAANAALDHRRAALALERLAAADPARLESLPLPLKQRSDGSWASRSALELLASHLESAGQASRAANLLLLSRNADAPAAERLAQAARLLADLPTELREPLFERALEQAAAAGSWGLVGELLAAQASLPASPDAEARTAERRLRLSRRLDDAYGEWRALQAANDPGSEARRQALLQQLRSPLAAGGHAESLPAPEPLPPLFSGDQARSSQPTPDTAGPQAPATEDIPASPGPARQPETLSPTGSPVPSQP